MLLLFWVLLLMLSQSPGEFKLDFTDIFMSKCPCLDSLLSAFAKHREKNYDDGYCLLRRTMVSGTLT